MKAEGENRKVYPPVFSPAGVVAGWRAEGGLKFRFEKIYDTIA